MKSKYSDTYFAFHNAVNHQDYTKWFSPVILAVDTWSIHVWQTEATRARCYLRREREGVKTQHNWHNSLHVSARLYIAQHWVQCSHSCSLHSSLQHLYFQARLLSTWRTPTLSCATSGPATKSFDVPAPKSSFSTIRLKLPRLATTALVQSSVFPSDTPTDSSSQVSRAFAILSTSSPVSSVKKSRACKPNYGNSLVVFTTLKNQTSLILTTSLATAKYTTGICLLRALIRASTLSKEIIHAVAATS